MAVFQSIQSSSRQILRQTGTKPHRIVQIWTEKVLCCQFQFNASALHKQTILARNACLRVENRISDHLHVFGQTWSCKRWQIDFLCVKVDNTFTTTVCIRVNVSTIYITSGLTPRLHYTCFSCQKFYAWCVFLQQLYRRDYRATYALCKRV